MFILVWSIALVWNTFTSPNWIPVLFGVFFQQTTPIESNHMDNNSSRRITFCFCMDSLRRYFCCWRRRRRHVIFYDKFLRWMILIVVTFPLLLFAKGNFTHAKGEEIFHRFDGCEWQRNFPLFSPVCGYQTHKHHVGVQSKNLTPMIHLMGLFYHSHFLFSLRWRKTFHACCQF